MRNRSAQYELILSPKIYLKKTMIDLEVDGTMALE